MKSIESVTLEQLEGDVWPEPDFHSHLVKTCHRLRKVPLSDFGIEELRIMLGQSIGSKYLLPKAVDVLEANPFAGGDMFDGDLVVAIARHPDKCVSLEAITKARLAQICRAVIGSHDGQLDQTHIRHVENLLMKITS